MKFKICPVILLIFFIIAFHYRVNLDGIHPYNPGNVKASDPVFHSLESGHIAEKGVIGFYPPYIAEGKEDILNTVPPLFHIITGSIIALTGIQDWNVAYFMASIFSALAIVIAYLISREIFKSEILALITAGLLIVPLRSDMWMYYLFIGIWPQNSTYTFALFILFLTILWNASQHEKEILLSFIAIQISAIHLLHFSVHTLLIPVYIYIVYAILKEKTTIQKKALNMTLIGAIPLFFFITSYPLILGFRAGGLVKIAFKWSAMNPQSYIPTLSTLPKIYLLLSTLGIIILFYNYKKYIFLLAYILYSFFLFFIIPHFIEDPYYISHRPRITIIFILAIFTAYTLYILLRQIFKTPSGKDTVITIAIIIIALILALPQYTAFQKAVSYQNIPQIRYEGQEWVQQHTTTNATLYYFGAQDQYPYAFTKRELYLVSLEKIGTAIQTAGGTIPTSYEGSWNSVWWSGRKSMNGPFTYKEYDKKKIPDTIFDTDYVYFENLPGMEEFNKAIIQQLTTKENMTIKFQNQFITILKNNRGKA